MKNILFAIPVIVQLSGCSNMLASQDLAFLNCNKLGYEGEAKKECVIQETANIRHYRASKPAAPAYDWQGAMRDFNNNPNPALRNMQQLNDATYGRTYNVRIIK